MSKLLVYNLRKEKRSHSLSASGASNRWNKREEYVIYTGSSRALSVLELTAHRSFIRIDESYRILIIELNIDEDDIQIVEEKNLPENWRSVASYSFLQKLGSEWYQKSDKLVLKVPSALVPKEFNYLINTRHPKFETHVKIRDIEEFNWDERLV